MNIGFDLDEIFVSHPPFVPSWIIERLYREKSNGVLLYKIPGTFEQSIRILSHHPFLRPLLKENIELIRKFSTTTSSHLFLISSRFSFLKNRTKKLLASAKLDTVFKDMYFNYHDEQPHIFKSKIISKLHIQKFVDDDLPLLRYLSHRHPKTIFYWLNKKANEKIDANLFAITNLAQMLQ